MGKAHKDGALAPKSPTPPKTIMSHVKRKCATRWSCLCDFREKTKDRVRITLREDSQLRWWRSRERVLGPYLPCVLLLERMASVEARALS